MADEHHPQHLPERLLQAGVTKRVSKELGTMFQDMGELTKGMSEADAQTAKLMLLEMVRTGCGEFYTKMKPRLERKHQE